MRRREFIAGLGGAAAAWPLALRAQQPAMPVIGYLGAGTLDTERETVAAFHRGLSETGYVEGRNVATEYRWAESHNDRLTGLTSELVRRKVAVIVAVAGGAGALAAKAAAKSIPIVFQVGFDPVAAGLVASLNRPGSNLTGIFVLNAAAVAKRLEQLHELVLAATTIAYLVNPTNPVFAEAEKRELQVAARTLGLRLLILNASDPSEFEGAFATLVRERAGGLVVSGDLLFFNHTHQLVALAARHAVPAIYGRRDYTVAGGLMSCGPDFYDTARQVGVYTSRILNGEKPADLPVQQSTKVELIINLKTAKALGLTVPQSILLRADEVIE
jgi:putative tryptophan/tyrosine transport system substrate-binding protein